MVCRWEGGERVGVFSQWGRWGKTSVQTSSNPKAAAVRVATTFNYEASVSFKDGEFEILSNLNVYVQGVRTIPVGFKTEL